MSEIIPASTWGRTLKGTPPRPGVVTEMTVHYTGAPSVNATPDEIPARIKRTEQGQMAKDPNLSAVGYNFFIDKWGRIWEGRGYTYRNAANGGDSVHFTKKSSNPWTMSVCLIIGVKDNQPTPEIVTALRWLWRDMNRQFGRTLNIQGHQAHRPTACPGVEVMKLINSGGITSKGYNVTRIAGANRYETAVEVSKRAFPAGAAVAIIVSGLNFPDALTVAPFTNRGPILLTDPNRLPPETVTEIRRLKVKDIIIVGGTSAVSTKVENELAALVP
jgi:hypothetical protein